MTKAAKDYEGCALCDLSIRKGEEYQVIADEEDFMETRKGERKVIPGREFLRLHDECFDLLCDGWECALPEKSVIYGMYSPELQGLSMPELLKHRPNGNYDDFEKFRIAYLRRLESE